MNHLSSTTAPFTREAGRPLPGATSGFLYLLAVPLGAAVGMVGPPITIAGYNYTGFVWLFFLVAGILLILNEKAAHRDSRIYCPGMIWLVWAGFLWLSLLWCEPLEARNIQDALQISMPLLVAAVASLVVRSEEQLDRLLRMFWPTVLLLCLCPLALYLGVLGILNLTLAERPLALAAALAGCVFLAGCPARFLVPLLGWGICVLLTVVTGSRMATVALLLVPALHPLYPSRLLHGGVLLGIAGLGVALFYTPIFQQRFFHEGSGSLLDVFEGNFLSFGRFEAWPDIWEEAWRRPTFGHGIGSAFNFVPTVWEDMNHVHNDYLRVGFELGLVGVVLFVGSLLWQLWDLRRRIRRSGGTLRTAFTASWLGLVVLMITAFTDNTLSYNLWYMNPLFAVLGAAYGVAGRQQQRLSAQGEV